MGKILEVKDIVLDPALQARVAMNAGAIDEWAEVLRDEERGEAWPFPPVEVIWDGERYWLWDGFHRVAAAKAAGVYRVPANVQAGSRDMALWRSAGANKTHGVKRTSMDKRRATEQALLIAPQRSDREIAYHVGVSAPTVGKIRKELEIDCKFLQSTERVGADGRTINTANIGSQARAETQTTGEIPSQTERVGGESYLEIWQLESKVRFWLADQGGDSVALLEEIKRRSEEGKDLFEAVCFSIKEKFRAGEVWQAIMC